ncbi:MAG: hypothetical protein ACI8QI_000168 [Limisphaerales bacterium]|jgi:hypothetical protein
MQKLQVLFPEPTLKQLRSLANEEDRPVSEIIRRAVDRELSQWPTDEVTHRGALPDWWANDRGGPINTPADELKSTIYDKEI